MGLLSLAVHLRAYVDRSLSMRYPPFKAFTLVLNDLITSKIPSLFSPSSFPFTGDILKEKRNDEGEERDGNVTTVLVTLGKTYAPDPYSISSFSDRPRLPHLAQVE